MTTASTIKGGGRRSLLVHGQKVLFSLVYGLVPCSRARWQCCCNVPARTTFQCLVQTGTWVQISPLQMELLLPQDGEVLNKINPSLLLITLGELTKAQPPHPSIRPRPKTTLKESFQPSQTRQQPVTPQRPNKVIIYHFSLEKKLCSNDPISLQLV